MRPHAQAKELWAGDGTFESDEGMQLVGIWNLHNVQYAALRSASLTTSDPCLQPHELRFFGSPTWVVLGDLVSELSSHVLKASGAYNLNLWCSYHVISRLVVLVSHWMKTICMLICSELKLNWNTSVSGSVVFKLQFGQAVWMVFLMMFFLGNLYWLSGRCWEILYCPFHA